MQRILVPCLMFISMLSIAGGCDDGPSPSPRHGASNAPRSASRTANAESTPASVSSARTDAPDAGDQDDLPFADAAGEGAMRVEDVFLRRRTLAADTPAEWEMRHHAPLDSTANAVGGISFMAPMRELFFLHCYHYAEFKHEPLAYARMQTTRYRKLVKRAASFTDPPTWYHVSRPHGSATRAWFSYVHRSKGSPITITHVGYAAVPGIKGAVIVELMMDVEDAAIAEAAFLTVLHSLRVEDL